MDLASIQFDSRYTLIDRWYVNFFNVCMYVKQLIMRIGNEIKLFIGKINNLTKFTDYLISVWDNLNGDIFWILFLVFGN